MGEILDTYCDICNKVKETRFIPLYVIGSEGTRLCHECEMIVVEFIRTKRREYQQEVIRARLAERR